jgi:hypothetical protein
VTVVGWRRAALVLGGLCLLLQWRACHQPRPRAAPCPDAAAERPRRPEPARDDAASAELDREVAEAPPAPASSDDSSPRSLWGVRIPPWLRWLAPQPGESLLAYRDRVAPLAQAAVAPQRARVARSRADLIERLRLDARQQAELDEAVRDAASQIQDRVMNAALSGELAPSQLKPMAGVRVARDVLELVDQADRRFTSSLRDDQLRELTRHPFDVADYLLFSWRWENAIGVP